MKNRGRAEKLVLVILIVVLVVVSIYNVMYHSGDFWKINVFNCFTVIIGIVVSYGFNKINNTLVKRKEMMKCVVEELLRIISSRTSYEITENSKAEDLTITKRNINNYIGILEKYGTDLWDKEHIVKLKNYADEYSEVIGNHIADMEYLMKSKLELNRPLDLMKTELYTMLLELFL